LEKTNSREPTANNRQTTYGEGANTMAVSSFVLAGAGLGLLITLIMAALLGFGKGEPDRLGISAYMRIVAEFVLLAVALFMLVSAALLQSTDVWQLVSGYLGVRIVALFLEYLAHR